VVAARPLTIDEAKTKVIEAIKTQRAREMVSNKGPQAAHELRDTLKSGAPLKFALEKANVKAEKIAPFSPADDEEIKLGQDQSKELPDLRLIKGLARDLNTGDVSEFYPTNDGGLIVVMEKHEP